MTAKRQAVTDTGPVVSFKGFDANLRCRGFQFEVGGSYEHEDDVESCASGFHACENPMDVFAYYGPGNSRYATVRQDGRLSRHDGDSKIASAKITVEAEIKLPEFIAAAIKYVFDAATLKNGVKNVAGKGEAVAVQGYRSAAIATGYRSAAIATGERSAASATGDSSAAIATGYSSAAIATGYRSAAMACGVEGKVSGISGCALFLVYRDQSTWDILHAWAGIVGKDGIKPDVFYKLTATGEPVEVAQS